MVFRKKSERSKSIKTSSLKTTYDQFSGFFSENEEIAMHELIQILFLIIA